MNEAHYEEEEEEENNDHIGSSWVRLCIYLLYMERTSDFIAADLYMEQEMVMRCKWATIFIMWMWVSECMNDMEAK